MTEILALRDIPKLEDFLSNCKYPSLPNIADYIGRLWRSNQGDQVESPLGMKLSDANEIASIVLEYRAQQQLKSGTVQIKKVAEIRGSRFNTGKLRMDLIDPLAQEGLAAVLTKGAIKYSSHNWRQGLPYMEIIASMLRHIAAVSKGEDVDPETGELHADHIQCNAMFLSNMMKTRPDMDDRWKPLANTPEQVEAAMRQPKSS